MPSLYVDIVAPDHSVFKGEATIVRAPGVEGSFEVLYNHAPMIAAFDVGPLYLTLPSGERVVFATSGGFLEVLNNTVTILAETAEPASAIDVERARAAEQRALERLQRSASSEERRRAEQALERARNRLRIAMGKV
ncbi:MAG: F0F1 ATP synthase subunit epsilon [Bacteroidetes bacterium]|nr:ATP synthase F1 subunit epsilon [Rhodothermaceae bacterium RA]RMH66450.1 MAG: F0F1 ATP synthase subunit epsilon [Bacteroidota bacterium]